MADLSNLANADYVAAVNRAINHVTAHLDAPPALHEVAAVAGFSPFHFHRIFKAVTGETLHDFSTRVRLEQAVRLMAHSRRRLTDIALDCGFASGSDFSRAFRATYGVAPSRFDVAAWRRSGRDALAARVPDARASDIARGVGLETFAAAVRRLPPRRVGLSSCVRRLQRRRADGGGGDDGVGAGPRLAGGQWLGYDRGGKPGQSCRSTAAGTTSGSKSRRMCRSTRTCRKSGSRP